MMQAVSITDSYDAGLLWELREILWNEIAIFIKLSNRFLVSLSLGHAPPVWPLILDLARVWSLA